MTKKRLKRRVHKVPADLSGKENNSFSILSSKLDRRRSYVRRCTVVVVFPTARESVRVGGSEGGTVIIRQGLRVELFVREEWLELKVRCCPLYILFTRSLEGKK